jgi:hypothetical protein
VKRADELGSVDMISKEVINAIFTYDVAIADLTFLNPNVFYEIGLRHMVELPLIHIASSGTQLPFDNAGVNTIWFDVDVWKSHEHTRERIAAAVKERLKPGYKVSNPVTQARAELKLAESSDTQEQLMAQIISRLEHLEQARRSDAQRLRRQNAVLGGAVPNIFSAGTAGANTGLYSINAGLLSDPVSSFHTRVGEEEEEEP